MARSPEARIADAGRAFEGYIAGRLATTSPHEVCVRLTPVDIKTQSFARRLRGFDPDEVRGFLETAAMTLMEVQSERDELQLRVSRLTERLDEYERFEGAVRQNADRAQKVIEEEVAKARGDADAIRREAERWAEQFRQEQERKMYALKEQLARFSVMKDAFLQRMVKLLDYQRQALATALNDPEDAKARALREEIPEVDHRPLAGIEYARRQHHHGSPQTVPVIVAFRTDRKNR